MLVLGVMAKFPGFFFSGIMIFQVFGRFRTRFSDSLLVMVTGLSGVQFGL